MGFEPRKSGSGVHPLVYNIIKQAFIGVLAAKNTKMNEVWSCPQGGYRANSSFSKAFLQGSAKKNDGNFPPRIPIALHPFLSHGTFTGGLLLFVFTSQIPYLKGIYYTLFTFVLNVDAVKWF